jgi:dual specificity phosphatase 12
MVQLRVWGEVGYQIWEDEERRITKELYRHYLETRAVRLKMKGLTGNEPTSPQRL